MAGFVMPWMRYRQSQKLHRKHVRWSSGRSWILSRRTRRCLAPAFPTGMPSSTTLATKKKKKETDIAQASMHAAINAAGFLVTKAAAAVASFSQIHLSEALSSLGLGAPRAFCTFDFLELEVVSAITSQRCRHWTEAKCRQRCADLVLIRDWKEGLLAYG